jgi:hypothetical protein
MPLIAPSALRVVNDEERSLSRKTTYLAPPCSAPITISSVVPPVVLLMTTAGEENEIGRIPKDCDEVGVFASCLSRTDTTGK